MRSRRRPAAIGLIALMAIGSVALWIVIPVAWIWIASQLSEGSNPQLGPYLLVIVAVPLSMYFVGRGLNRLNHIYGRVTGTTPTVRFQAAWLRSLRGEREGSAPRTVLDVVMVMSVGVALVALAIWFFLFAGSSLPR